jgi:hypothetical protein
VQKSEFKQQDELVPPFDAKLDLNLAEIFIFYARKYIDKVAGKDFAQ